MVDHESLEGNTQHSKRQKKKGGGRRKGRKMWQRVPKDHFLIELAEKVHFAQYEDLNRRHCDNRC